MGGGTGCLPGRDVKRDRAMHVYISYLSRSVYMERMLTGTFFVPFRQSGIPVRSTGIPGKAAQFLSCKHSVPLCRGDMMLTLQIVPGEIVPGRNILM